MLHCFARIADSVLAVVLLGVVHLPSARREDVLVSFVPSALADLAGVRLVALDAGIRHETNVLVHVKVEEGARLASRLRANKSI